MYTPGDEQTLRRMPISLRQPPACAAFVPAQIPSDENGGIAF